MQGPPNNGFLGIFNILILLAAHLCRNIIWSLLSQLSNITKLNVQCLAEKLAVSLSGIRKAAVVFILDELQKSLICGLKELEICHNLQL